MVVQRTLKEWHLTDWLSRTTSKFLVYCEKDSDSVRFTTLNLKCRFVVSGQEMWFQCVNKTVTLKVSGLITKFKHY